jgi:hypothetical protein
MILEINTLFEKDLIMGVTTSKGMEDAMGNVILLGTPLFVLLAFFLIKIKLKGIPAGPRLYAAFLLSASLFLFLLSISLGIFFRIGLSPGMDESQVKIGHFSKLFSVHPFTWCLFLLGFGLAVLGVLIIKKESDPSFRGGKKNLTSSE